MQRLAELALDFAGPVLLINGDTHLFQDDRPLNNLDAATPIGNINTNVYEIDTPVPNLRRITVQGSTNKPREWLRLTIDPRAASPDVFTVFSVDNIVYCDNTTCPN